MDEKTLGDVPGKEQVVFGEILSSTEDQKEGRLPMLAVGLSLSTSDISDLSILFGCVVRHLAAFLASVHWMPAARFSPPTPRYLWTLLNVPWGPIHPWLRTTALGVWPITTPVLKGKTSILAHLRGLAFGGT